MKLLNFHTHHLPQTNDEVAILNLNSDDVASYTGICSIGLHPWYLNVHDLQNQTDVIQQMAVLNQVVAIGECGLDHLCGVDFQLQLEVFESMIHISELHQKPLIIHCVKAFDELIAIKLRKRPAQNWILHGFRGNTKQAMQLLKLGFLFSFGVKFNMQTIKDLPLISFFIETDDSQVDIESIYQKIAFDKQLSVETLAENVRNNAYNLLNLKI